MPDAPVSQRPILILAPLIGDAEAMCQVLTRAGFIASACACVTDLTAAISDDTGAVIVAEEGLLPPGAVANLAGALARQPEWSDLPVLLLAAPSGDEDGAWALVQSFDGVGNIAILERPLRRSTLLNAIGAALRARRRQHELRVLLDRRAADADTLRASEHRFRTMADAMPQLAWIARPDGHIEWYNQRWHEYTGTTLEQTQGWGWHIVHDPNVLPLVLANWRRSLASGEPFEMEFPLHGADGRFRPFLTRGVPLKDGAGRVLQWLGTCTDVSEQHRVRAELAAHKERLEALVDERTAELEDSLHKLHASERLAALGTLAAGLGHDIANLVMPIRMRLDVLRADGNEKDIEAINHALTYLTNISAGLRLMALDPAREAASHEVDDLAQWWSQSQSALRSVLPRHVRLEGTITAGVGVCMPAHRLTQAVFNLVQNAGEAMADGAKGHVRVSTAIVPGGREVRISVADNGPGMTPDVRARCLEPYFSTKGRAIATGMGLWMVRGLAEAAGGSLEVESEPGCGATFTITLPLIETALPNGPAPVVPAAPSGRAAISITDPRAASIVRMLLEGLELPVEGQNGCATAESTVWVAQDPSESAVREYLARSPHGRIVILRSREALRTAGRAEDRVTVLPLSAPPSALRCALLSAARGAASLPGRDR